MKIGTCEIKNRIVMSPMLMGFGQFDGCTTEQMMDYYEERAKGGTGLIIVENASVDSPQGSNGTTQVRRLLHNWVQATTIRLQVFTNSASVYIVTARNCSCSCTIPADKTWGLQSALCQSVLL